MRDYKLSPASKLNYLCTAAVVVSLALYVSANAQPPAARGGVPPQKPAAAAAQKPVASAGPGELVYVPIYSSIFYENGKHTLELAATLSIHNVNPDHSITILRADYHSTDGKLIRKYVDKPLILSPLQTTNLVVEKENRAGGTGANFLVEWQAGPEATSPVIEALMVNATSNLGIAFNTTGKVVRKIGPAPK